MIAGHFGFAAFAKSREPRVPLWCLMLATVWLDIVFVPMFVMKLETFGAGSWPSRWVWGKHHPCRLHTFPGWCIGTFLDLRSHLWCAMGQALCYRAGARLFFSLAA